jgi:predicted amidohydrolase
MATDFLRLSIHQTAPVLGEVEENLEGIRCRLRESRERDLVAFPELSVTGYGLGSRASRLARSLPESSALGLPPGHPPVCLSLPERGEDELIYNAAVLVHQDRVLAKHRKVYLPTYGLFDEGRFFARGQDAPPVVTLPSGWRVGLLVCEDFWHPALQYLLAIQGADVALVLAAAPGRGDPSGLGETPEPGHHLFSSSATWTLLARTAALQFGMFVALVNRGGVEGGVTFAGESIVVGPDGSILARAPQREPYVLEVDLSRGSLRGARSPYAHLRDEDPDFLLRAMMKLRGRV